MKCSVCRKDTNGSYYKGKPICGNCWKKRKPNKRKVSVFWKKWIKEIPEKKK